jgi:hypothetical protein
MKLQDFYPIVVTVGHAGVVMSPRVGAQVP